METERILELRRRIRSLTKELNECVSELVILVDTDVPESGATSEQMGIQSQLSRLIDRKGLDR